MESRLFQERLSWRKKFEKGEAPSSPALKDYRDNRESSTWRMSKAAEELCEYILFLENKVDPELKRTPKEKGAPRPEHKLYLCAEETGQEGVIDTGTEEEMVSKLLELASLDQDVWVITPIGTKILPY